jgi:hypothetical protein
MLDPLHDLVGDQPGVAPAATTPRVSSEIRAVADDVLSRSKIIARFAGETGRQLRPGVNAGAKVRPSEHS